MSGASTNRFLHAPLGATYAKTALPIIFVMGLNGLLAVTDALFLGHYVGPQALAAVTLMFPLYMLIVALATLVSGGMSSILARHLGAGRLEEARSVFAGAHGLALLFGLTLYLLFALLGRDVSLLAAGGEPELARLGLIYLRLTVLFSPLMFVLSVNSDALRNEGRVGLMAATSVLVSLSNIVFNWVLIAQFHLGVAGSAYGTALAQALAFAIILTFRLRGTTELRVSALARQGLTGSWRRMLALGAPQSLNFIGLALGSAAIMAALQIVRSPDYQATVSAYGIVTRVLTFGFLPLLGLSHAMQTITGNNYGARLWRRSDTSLKVALGAAVIYCICVQAGLSLFATRIGQSFVDDPAVIAEVARILPVILALFFLAGPIMILASHFQAIGDAPRAAVLGLSKPYLFAIPLTFLLAQRVGEAGIWMAAPVADFLLLLLTGLVLAHASARTSRRLGLFHRTPGAAQ